MLWSKVRIEPDSFQPILTPEHALDYPKEIFKAYDIRGIVGKTIIPEITEAIGHAIGSEAIARGFQKSGIGVVDRSASQSNPAPKPPYP